MFNGAGHVVQVISRLLKNTFNIIARNDFL